MTELIPIGARECRQHLILDILHGPIETLKQSPARRAEKQEPVGAIRGIIAAQHETTIREHDDDIRNRLRRHERASGQLGRGEAIATTKHRQCGVLHDRDSRLSQNLVKSNANRKLQLLDSIEAGWFAIVLVSLPCCQNDYLLGM